MCRGELLQIRACVLGHFGEGTNLLNGQTIKTKIITEELQNQLGQEQVLRMDTHGGWKTLLKAPLQVFHALKNSANVLMFPAHNGLRIYAPLLFLLKRLFKGRKLHHIVIGGWLPEFLQKRKWLSAVLKTFDGIYVETGTMQRALEEQGFKNVLVMPNCKKLQVLREEELVYPAGMPWKLCTFSRVMREKGIEDAVDAVRTVNETLGSTVYTLDIYGQIDAAQAEWFADLQKSFPEYISYKGCVDADKSVEVLKEYFALLFPTHFYTEGIPGTIIDAYAAGIPVISAKWESYSDLVVEGVTGVGYDFGEKEKLAQMLLHAAESPKTFFDMKQNCICQASAYLPKTAIQILINRME